MSIVLPPERLQKVLGYTFNEQRLIRQALTHRSYAATHNERLEFVGDAVLNAVVGRALFVHFPQLNEGELSRLRASLVRQESLADVASTLELGDYLSLGEGELKSGGHRRPSILADALEAIFGAIWLDGGFEAAQTVVEMLFVPRITAIDPSKASKTPRQPCRNGCRRATKRCRCMRWYARKANRLIWCLRWRAMCPSWRCKPVPRCQPACGGTSGRGRCAGHPQREISG